MATTKETPAEALARIQSRVSKNDFAAIVQFAECGIHPNDISPRLNVLTFKAWTALGRRVAKGATGQKVCVWVPVEKDGKEDGVRPITAVLFHITQTIAEDAEKGTRPEAWQNPLLVKEGTYEPTETPADEPQTGMIVAPASDIIDVEYTIEPAPQKRLTAQAAQKQLSLF
jgi:hypothetical protein